ncbi:MAG: hypothetical protein JWO86_3728 [Myxococcaceae bacterium]|nr:hypothetical protein [Myxococcaceae bacterium]MEA2753474.1 hypothetical protein [Myxococcales bacterium]
MDVVALMALASSVEDEAPRLAADLGSTAYEAGLLLRSPSPVPLLRTEDRARALDLLAKLRARGHDAVACDAGAVVSTGAMTQVRSFRMDDGAFVVTSGNDATTVPWSDVRALVRAIHRTSSEHIEKSAEKKLSLGRAAMSGGVMLTKTVTKTAKHTVEEREQVLYVFRDNGTPLLAALSRTRYDGLGADLRPSQIENFNTLVRAVRARAPQAIYDERLLAPRPGIERVTPGASGTVSASSSDGIDLLAHLIALAGTRAQRPYR